MTLQLGGPIPCWHVSPSLLLLFVFITIININKGRDKSGAHTFWLSMGVYMGLGMDLLASTFERFVLLKNAPRSFYRRVPLDLSLIQI